MERMVNLPMSKSTYWKARIDEETRTDRMNRTTTKTRAWVQQEGGNFIASVRSAHAKKAYLMAAAPELYDYCKFFYALLDDMDGRPGASEMRDELGELLESIKKNGGVA